MYVGYDLDAGTFRSFVRFDLSGIPSGSTINSASLNAYADGVSGSPIIDVYRVLSSWGEHKITWNNQPDVEEVPTVSREVSYDDEGKWVSWDVSQAVQQWVNGSLNCGIVLITKSSDINKNILSKLASDNYSDDPALCPRLFIEYR